jgi:hypothetical protein
MRRRAFSALFTEGEPFDWPTFLREFPFQPVPLWLVLGAAATPTTNALLALSRATCEGRLRALTLSFASVVYALIAPASCAGLYYACFGRSRLTRALHRRIGDATLVLLLAASAFNAARFADVVHADWERLAPGFAAMRAACWPPPSPK